MKFEVLKKYEVLKKFEVVWRYFKFWRILNFWEKKMKFWKIWSFEEIWVSEEKKLKFWIFYCQELIHWSAYNKSFSQSVDLGARILKSRGERKEQVTWLACCDWGYRVKKCQDLVIKVPASSRFAKRWSWARRAHDQGFSAYRP